MSTENQQPKKSDPNSDDSSRSPGVTDRGVSSSDKSQGDEIKETERENKKESPGVQDRG